MNKIILLTILCILSVGCFVPGPPNPGFRVRTLIAVNQNLPWLPPVYIPAPRPNTITNGDYVYFPGKYPQGTINTFRGSISNYAGEFDIRGGYAPADWRFEAVRGWGQCNGLANFFETEPGRVTEATCYEDGDFRIFPLAPSTVNQYSQPVILQASINNVDTSYGMPIFHFEDYTGQLMATTTAMQVNGTDVRISSNSLTSLPVGTYSVKAYNAPSPNSFNRPIGTSTIVVQPKPPADLAVWRPTSGTWYILNSSDRQWTTAQWGVSTDKPVRGDFDADGKTDFCVFRPSDSTWYEMRSGANQLVSQQFGISSDTPVPADYDGDGKTDIAVFRKTDRNWYILQSSDSTISYINFGVSDDMPVPADYDGDGKADVAQYRKSSGDWFWLQSGNNNAFIGQHFGAANTDNPVIGDYDGDGKYDLAVWRTTNNVWYINNSSDNSLTGIQWGDHTIDDAVQGDFDADGKTDIAVWRKTGALVGLWQIRNSSTGQTRTDSWGTTGDIPVPAPYAR